MSATSDAQRLRQDLIRQASPPCHECGSPVQRVEMRWHLDDANQWRPGPAALVCAHGHRVPVTPFTTTEEDPP